MEKREGMNLLLFHLHFGFFFFTFLNTESSTIIVCTVISPLSEVKQKNKNNWLLNMDYEFFLKGLFTFFYPTLPFLF